MKKILIASQNKGKIEEIKRIFEKDDISFISLKQYPDLGEVIEDGQTFTKNALKKARIRSEETGLTTLADDSGLVVAYLNGEPGIYSARYAGKNASDQENNQKLLKKLQNVPREKRKAYFKCVMALVNPDKEKEITVSGICRGFITTRPQGTNGFGYDPLFYVPEYGKTMAELPATVKNRISHRALALEKLKNILPDFF